MTRLGVSGACAAATVCARLAGYIGNPRFTIKRRYLGHSHNAQKTELVLP